jgi:hypothetical protein|uniref:Uncharacterized protein n=1 Tax=Picea glauca TaxID=3330 RepID=A0A101LZ66_PICGL|nr:hypothetical protein ABT39_MTgene4952 [Picea glauca]QHR90379.1 hypothetical protein Q903MT_gene4402 [Picea sitchensis]
MEIIVSKRRRKQALLIGSIPISLSNCKRRSSYGSFRSAKPRSRSFSISTGGDEFMSAMSADGFWPTKMQWAQLKYRGCWLGPQVGKSD